MANNVAFVLGPLPIINPETDVQPVDGLSSAIGSLVVGSDFGDSGDIFDHMSWRGLFALLNSTESGKNFLVSLAGMLLLRGQQLKLQHRGKTVKYNFAVNSLTAEELKNNPYFTGKANVTIPISFATESSRVMSRTLTMERAKCCLRVHVTPAMMKMKRFAAVSTTNGYQKLVLALHEMIEHSGNLDNFFIEIAKPKKESSVNFTSAVEFDAWQKSALSANANGSKKYFSIAAAYSGCFSSKEIYEYDEEKIPGCLFWSGLHALMTDICNKFRANKVTADVRTRYENSNFYDDFKRKMAARKMTIVNSKGYQDYLTSMAHVVPIYVLSATSLKTEEEVKIIDSIMQQISTLEKTTEGLTRSTASTAQKPHLSIDAADLENLIGAGTSKKSSQASIKLIP